MKDIGTAKSVDCTFQFYHIRPNGSVIVFFETTLRDGSRLLSMKMPINAAEQQQVIEAIKRAEQLRLHFRKPKKLDHTPKATTAGKANKEEKLHFTASH